MVLSVEVVSMMLHNKPIDKHTYMNILKIIGITENDVNKPPEIEEKFFFVKSIGYGYS